MMVFSSRQAIQGLQVFQHLGARFFYRRRRSDHQRCVQQRGQMVARQGQANEGREHRAELGAGAGEFQGGTSFRFIGGRGRCRTGPAPGLGEPAPRPRPPVKREDGVEPSRKAPRSNCATVASPMTRRRRRRKAHIRRRREIRLTRGGAAHSPRAARVV